MDLGIVSTIARKEIRDSLRNRWFLLYAVAFAVLSLSLSYLSLVSAGSYGVEGFGRTAAGLVNLVLLIVPLMALTVGAGSVAQDDERGTLDYMLSQPVHRIEVLLGKYVGLAISMVATLALGFGGSALVMARSGTAGDPRSYGALVALSFVLALAMLSLGFLISILARKTSVALGMALFSWLALAFLSDLGLMGGTLAFKLHVSDLFRLALVNPLQVFKMAVLSSIHATLDLLGPAGLYATQKYGNGLALLFGTSLTVWILAPLSIAMFLFRRRGES